MLSRVFVRSLLANRAVKCVVHSTRHNNLKRISSILSKFSQPITQILRHSSDEDYEEVSDDSFYDLLRISNKYLPSNDIEKDDLLREIDDFIEIDQVKKCIENRLDQLNKNHIMKLLLMSGKLRSKNELTIITNINNFLSKIENLLPNINNEVELGIIAIHLRLLGIRRTNGTMEKVIDKLLEIFKKKGERSSLFALSLFTETMVIEKDLYSKLRMVETLPIIKQNFEKIDNELDYFHLISCLNNVHTLLSQDAMEEYKIQIEKFLDKNIINSTRVLFKTINFLNYPHWSTLNTELIQKLLILLQNRVSTMNTKELIQTNKAFYVSCEPASLIIHMKNQAKEILEKTQDVELLQIVCMYCSPKERTKFVEMFKDKLLKFQTTLGPATDSLGTFFKILRLLRISDNELCDCFWTKIVNKIFSLPLPDLKYRLPKYFHRYMNFNNNLGGTYRHIEFEKIVYEYCIEEMKTTSAYIPRDFVKCASFVIAYSDQYDSIPPFVIEKIIMIQDQLNINDCKILSRALEINYGFRVRGTRSATLENQIEILKFIMDNCTKRHLQNPDNSVKNINTILSSYVRRRASRDSQLFYKIMGWYSGKKLDLDSRTIRELCNSLQACKFSMDSVCDQFFEYIKDNKDMVTGETVEKILTTCYNLSYFPENFEVFDHCNEIIRRDFDVMNGLSIVQALLALTFYKAAPFELVSLVFNGDFIRRLEQEIEMAYSKDTYPRRVMTLVMQLNRSICLDNPEYNIKWFQQNFIEAQMSKKPINQSKFHNEVQNLLLNIVPNKQYLAINKNTPYGYRIDFEIHIDKNYNKFLKIDPNDYIGINFKPQINKIAIILLGFDNFCINDVNRLRGSELLRMRHLEMMNYKVIHVKRRDFRMLYENVAAKINHLKKLLEISG